MDYEGWQTDDTLSISENVKQAIAVYIRKHGNPPNILETSLKEVPIPEGISLVWINLPKNILLVGEL